MEIVNAKRFWERVEVKGKNDCWEWMGKKKPSGSAVVKLADGHECSAHRVAAYLNGIVSSLIQSNAPEKETAVHTCGNSLCCNPRHIKNSTRVQKGEGKRGSSKRRNLTDEEADQVRRLYKQGYQNKTELGNMFKVCRQSILKIINNEAYTTK